MAIEAVQLQAWPRTRFVNSIEHMTHCTGCTCNLDPQEHASPTDTTPLLPRTNSCALNYVVPSDSYFAQLCRKEKECQTDLVPNCADTAHSS